MLFVRVYAWACASACAVRMRACVLLGNITLYKFFPYWSHYGVVLFKLLVLITNLDVHSRAACSCFFGSVLYTSPSIVVTSN